MDISLNWAWTQLTLKLCFAWQDKTHSFAETARPPPHSCWPHCPQEEPTANWKYTHKAKRINSCRRKDFLSFFFELQIIIMEIINQKGVCRQTKIIIPWWFFKFPVEKSEKFASLLHGPPLCLQIFFVYYFTGTFEFKNLATSTLTKNRY